MQEVDDRIDLGRNKMLIRVFINNCDTYIGHNIGELIANAIPQATLKETIEPDEATSQIEESADNASSMFTDSYEIVGTMEKPNTTKPSWLHKIVERTNAEELLNALKSCDVIIYDISEDVNALDETLWAVSTLQSQAETFEAIKTFICISTVMTWVKTKPLDLDDTEIPLSEEDFRRRVPHPNFRKHLKVEKSVIASGNKNSFLTYVAACGIVYGNEENIFHFLFKDAWSGKATLTCYGNGKNILPTIHIRDLASVLLNIVDRKPKTRYFVVVDNSHSTLGDIVTGISCQLGTGKVKYISKEDALLNRSLRQDEYDKITVNLRIEASHIRDYMSIEWTALSGMTDNMKKIVKEFKECRNLLKPIKICVLGPPEVGKSSISEQLSRYYNVHHIKIGDVISAVVSKLEQSVARSEEDLNEEELEQYTKDKELLENLRESKENNNGRYEDHYVHRFLRDKLKSMPCKNQGFVLDGYPKTFAQAQELFATLSNDDELIGINICNTDEGDDSDSEEDNLDYDPDIMPENAIWLDAPDEFLRNRVLNLPEKFVTGSHSTEDGFLRRLARFHEDNLDETVQNYFDDYMVRVDHIDLTQDTSQNYRKTILTIIDLLGASRNYTKTSSEWQVLIEKDRDEELRKLAAGRLIQLERENEEHEKWVVERDHWRAEKQKLVDKEQQALEERSVPIKKYLMKHVLPTLTQGLIECCRHRPDDPIDFLAEFVFKNNPEIDIF